MREILDSLDGMVYVSDMTTYETLFINQYGIRTWGDFTGKPCWQYLQAGQTGPCSFCTNHLLLRPDGTPAGIHVWEFQNTITQRWYECRDSAIRWPDRRIVRMEIALDITERKRLEQHDRLLQAQLTQAQKLDSLGSLAGGVAHDMNNVLGAILALASANLEVQPEDSPVRGAFATIIKAAERGGQMVKGLLSFARQSPAEEREVDLNAVLREEEVLLARTTLAKVRLVMDLAPDLRPIRGDAGALAHAFMNLCINAVDAMTGDGTLTLRTRNTEAGEVEVRVEDTGTGMPPEVLARALDPFFTTKEHGKGTGLGLSMAYGTVKAHHGTMELLSEPGVGTQVILRFPAVRAEDPAAPEPAASAAPGAPSRTVLLVDDDDLVRHSIETILHLLGHRTRAVTSGEEALAELADLRPDLVILDMNMPGLGGLGTLPRIRTLRPDVPVLVCTGRADQAALELVQAHPHVALLSKPFTAQDLQRHLEVLAAGPQA
jgi:signal transduction histidine kinase/ActR/RegA family two-component response regulator